MSTPSETPLRRALHDQLVREIREVLALLTDDDLAALEAHDFYARVRLRWYREHAEYTTREALDAGRHVEGKDA